MSRCRKIVICLFLLIPLNSASQFFWDFESGWPESWITNQNGRWAADNNAPLSGGFSLHHIYDNQANGVDMAGFRLTGIRPDLGIAEWSFLIRYGCDPSSSNNWSFLLLSDRPPSEMDPSSGLSGYAVGVNLTGYDDLLKLFKITKGDIEVVINTGVNWQTDVGTSGVSKVKISRSPEGNWELLLSDVDGNNPKSYYGFDDQLFASGWSGILYRYTSTRDRLLWLDDLSLNAVFVEDTIPPGIVTYNILAPDMVELLFDEPVGMASLSPADYLIRGEQALTCENIAVSGNSIVLSFSSVLANKQTSVLDIGFVCDGTGNCRLSDSLIITPVWAEEGDVIFSEIMYKPGPVVGLPDAEYLEVYNRTDYIFNLRGWKVTTETASYSISGGILGPGEFAILVKYSDTTLFEGMCHAIPMQSFPALTDEGRSVNLISDFNIPLHGVSYLPDWHSNILKSSGGWALEIVDTDYPFYYKGNWASSLSSKGGTPGKANSVAAINRDDVPPFIDNIFPIKDDELVITFSEPVNAVEESTGITVPGFEIEQIIREDNFGSVIAVKLNSSMKEGVVYTLLAGNIKDRAGNYFYSSPLPFGIPVAASPGDILFNEILFDPFPGGYDFIELVNTSDKILNAYDLLVAGSNPATSDTSSVSILSGKGRLIVPGTYYVVTRDVDNLTAIYPTHRREFIHGLSKMPSMPDDKGTLTLYTRGLTLLDRVSYDRKMHSDLVNDPEGVSLEKIRPDFESDSPYSWFSASASAGWATPGIENSAFIDDERNEAVAISSKTITPNGDGTDDNVVIDINFREPGTVVTVTVFSDHGSIVRELVSDYLCGSSCSFVWDATDYNNSQVERGVYIILLNGFSTNGRSYRKKFPVAVIR